MFTYSVWMPVARKHELSEMLKHAKALSKRKSYREKPYTHVRGGLFAAMDSETYVAALEAIRAQGLIAAAPRPCVSGPEYFDGRDWHHGEPSRRPPMRYPDEPRAFPFTVIQGGRSEFAEATP